MSKRIAKIESLDALISINGVPIEEIDRRCRPLEDRTQDKECWRLRSAAGFIPEGSKIVDVLKQDWETVLHTLGTTHTEVAALLTEVIDAARSMRPRGSLAPVDLTFRGTARLHVETFVFNAPQYSPFIRNPSTVAGKGAIPLEQQPQPLVVEPRGEASGAAHAPSALCKQCWDTEHVLTNVESGVSVRVAEGVVGFIDEIGFYEGGDANPYRVDPLILWGVLFGKPRGNPRLSGLIRDALIRVGDALAADVLHPLETIRGASYKNPEDEAWARSYAEREEAKASEIKASYKRLGDSFA